MAFFRASRIDALLARCGQDVTIGATTVKGVVDAPDEQYASDQTASLLVGTMIVQVKSGAFGSALAEGARLTTDGTNYRVQRFMATGDGALTTIEVAPE